MHTVSSLKGIRKKVNRLLSQQIGKKYWHLLPTKKLLAQIYTFLSVFRFQIWIRIGSDPDSTDSLDPDLGSSSPSPKEEKISCLNS